jgi:3D (Asp-Asp-Asp) domain-containing protein
MLIGKVIATVVITMTLTAYTDADVGMRGDGVMTSQLKTFDGACACGPAWPFGAVFWVPDLKRGCICQDRGGGIGNYDLDIWMSERPAALRFGKREAKVVVLYDGGKEDENRNQFSGLSNVAATSGDRGGCGCAEQRDRGIHPPLREAGAEMEGAGYIWF